MAETGLTGPWSEFLSRLVHLPDKVLQAMKRATLENAVGLVGRTKEYILHQEGPAPALHPFTLAMRTQGHGSGSPKRLIDHGDLLGAITFVVASDGLSARVGIPNDKTNAEGVNIAKIAAIQTHGAVIAVTDKMRAWLNANGLHLRKETNVIIIPPWPFLRPSYDAYKEKIKETYKRHFLNAIKAG